MISNIFTKQPLHGIIKNQVKAPLVALLNTIDKLLPEPTKENVRRRNSKILIEIRDEFLEHWRVKRAAMRAIAKIFIIVYDYDSPYTYAIDWWVEKLMQRQNFPARAVQLLEKTEVNIAALKELCSLKYAESQRKSGEWQPRQESDYDSRSWRKHDNLEGFMI